MWFPPVSVSMSRVFFMIIFTIIMINSSSEPGSCSGHGYSLLKSVELSEFSWSLITAPLLQCLALSLSIVQHTDKTVAPLPRPRGWQLFPVQHGDHVDISSCSSHTSSPAAHSLLHIQQPKLRHQTLTLTSPGATLSWHESTKQFTSKESLSHWVWSWLTPGGGGKQQSRDTPALRLTESLQSLSLFKLFLVEESSGEKSVVGWVWKHILTTEFWSHTLHKGETTKPQLSKLILIKYWIQSTYWPIIEVDWTTIKELLIVKLTGHKWLEL